MENITLGQIVGAIAVIMAIASFIGILIKTYKKAISDKFVAIYQIIDELKGKVKMHDTELKEIKEEIKESKEERLILLQGQLACLKGLKEQGCNGPVTEAINNIENYLMKKSHE